MALNITHRFFFPKSPETVWEYLTNTDLLELWLMPNDFQPTLGHAFQFRSKPKPDLQFDGIFHCKVLEIVPFKKLIYSLQAGPGDGEMTVDTVVEWELHPKENGTELLLEHRGFKEVVNLGLYTAMNAGWAIQVQKITEHLKAAKNGTANA